MNAVSDFKRQKYPKATYLWRHFICEMNIQLILVLLFFAAAVFFTARKFYRSLTRKKQSGCERCEPGKT
jgi:hypothetical protein